MKKALTCLLTYGPETKNTKKKITFKSHIM